METMEKPSRAPSIDGLQTYKELCNKRSDIIYCIQTAKTPELEAEYRKQKEYINNVIEARHGDGE